MIILTKINQLDNIDTITDKLKADISQSISILNTAYGVDRDVYNDLGGFCCIVSNEDDIKLLLDRWNADILNDISEVTLEIDGYIKKLFIISSDYAIVTYIKASLIDQHSKAEQLYDKDTDIIIKKYLKSVNEVIIAWGTLTNKTLKKREGNVLDILHKSNKKLLCVTDNLGHMNVHPLTPSVRKDFYIAEFK